jgi:hypothetical protein
MLRRKARMKAPVPPMAAGKRFGRYRKEAEKAMRRQDVEGDKVLQEMIRIWERPVEVNHTDESYDDLLPLFRDLRYTPHDVERFSLLLGHLQDVPNENPFVVFQMKAPAFLNALMIAGADHRYTVHTSHLRSLLFFLGQYNRKNVTIKGHGGHGAGFLMERGRLLIDGDTEGVGDKMKGGLIIVEGSEKSHPGDKMTGGRIVIRGDAGAKVGHHMEGGEIHIEGEYESLGDIERGRIYHKGKLIVDKWVHLL